MPSSLVTACCGRVMSFIVHAGHADRTQEAFQLLFFFQPTCTQFSQSSCLQRQRHCFVDFFQLYIPPFHVSRYSVFGFEHCQIQGDLQFKLCLNTSCVRPSCDAAAAVSTWCVCVCVQLVLKSWESWILDEMRLVWPLKQSRLLALKITSWTSSFQKCPCWQRDVS